MEQPCMRAYSLLLIKTCHRRGVFAMGGMSAQIPVKNNPQANEAALQKVCMMAVNHGVPGQGLRCWLTLQGSAKYWPVACRIVPAAREMRRQYMALYGRIRFGPRPARRTQVHPVALPPHMYNCCSLVRCLSAPLLARGYPMHCSNWSQISAHWPRSFRWARMGWLAEHAGRVAGEGGQGAGGKGWPRWYLGGPPRSGGRCPGHLQRRHAHPQPGGLPLPGIALPQVSRDASLAMSHRVHDTLGFQYDITRTSIWHASLQDAHIPSSPACNGAVTVPCSLSAPIEPSATLISPASEAILHPQEGAPVCTVKPTRLPSEWGAASGAAGFASCVSGACTFADWQQG